MENASAAFLDAVRKSMRAIRRAIGSTTITPELLTSAEKLRYESPRPFSFAAREREQD